MARASNTDFYHSFKYQVKVVTAGIEGASSLGAQGGFNSVTLPEITMEQVEYKEGTYLYRRKYPGDVTFSDLTLSRGVAKANTDFYKWIRAGFLGKEYRVDFIIRHFHRDDLQNLSDYTNAAAKRTITCYNAFPSRVKPGSDFDSMSSDVSLEECDITLEYFELSDSN